jgi:uncharacterized membrane protein YhiD involved in acid resistance
MEHLWTAFSQDAHAQLENLPILRLLPRLLVAVGIGFVLSARPWRRLLKQPLPRAEMVHAQILLCVAAAVITGVIGDSVAKAFGLVGLGGFVRFRSGLKDPRDAALLFLVIGLGMACGHGAMGIATAGTFFVALLLIALDLFGMRASPSRRLRVSAESDDLVGAEAHLRQVFKERNTIIHSCAYNFDRKSLELEVEESRTDTLSGVAQQVEKAGIRGLKWTEARI